MNRDRSVGAPFRTARPMMTLLVVAATVLAVRGDPAPEASPADRATATVFAMPDTVGEVRVLGPNQRNLVAECYAGIGSATLDVRGADAGRVEVLLVTAIGDTMGRHVNSQAEFRVAWLVLPGDCYRVFVTNLGTKPIEVRAGGDATPILPRMPRADTTSARPA